MINNSITCIDLGFLGLKETIATYAFPIDGGVALVETGPHSTINKLEEGLQQIGFKLEDVKHVFLTHIHLDHAGAAWAFAELGATIYVHPRGYKHLQNPVKLMVSAGRIYKDQMDQLWGQMKSIPEDQLVQVEHEQIIDLGTKKIKAFHTPGHAVHHIAWQLDDAIFCGDVAGVKIKDGPVVPPCPPPDIHVQDWQNSIQILTELNPSILYLTHFGQIENPVEHLKELEDMLLSWTYWMKPHFEAGTNPGIVTPLFMEFVKQQLLDGGVPESSIPLYEAANPSWMSVAGLLRYWKKIGFEAEP